jgi:hypothetical protein
MRSAMLQGRAFRSVRSSAPAADRHRPRPNPIACPTVALSGAHIPRCELPRKTIVRTILLHVPLIQASYRSPLWLKLLRQPGTTIWLSQGRRTEPMRFPVVRVRLGKLQRRLRVVS